VLIAVCLFPFAWMERARSRRRSTSSHSAAPLAAECDDLSNYRHGAVHPPSPILPKLVIISVASTGLALLLAGYLDSYGFRAVDFRGKSGCNRSCWSASLLPTAAIIVPLFITLRGWRD